MLWRFFVSDRPCTCVRPTSFTAHCSAFPRLQWPTCTFFPFLLSPCGSREVGVRAIGIKAPWPQRTFSLLNPRSSNTPTARWCVNFPSIQSSPMGIVLSVVFDGPSARGGKGTRAPGDPSSASRVFFFLPPALRKPWLQRKIDALDLMCVAATPLRTRADERALSQSIRISWRLLIAIALLYTLAPLELGVFSGGRCTGRGLRVSIFSRAKSPCNSPTSRDEDRAFWSRTWTPPLERFRDASASPAGAHARCRSHCMKFYLGRGGCVESRRTRSLARRVRTQSIIFPSWGLFRVWCGNGSDWDEMRGAFGG